MTCGAITIDEGIEGIFRDAHGTVLMLKTKGVSLPNRHFSVTFPEMVECVGQEWGQGPGGIVGPSGGTAHCLCSLTMASNAHSDKVTEQVNHSWVCVGEQHCRNKLPRPHPQALHPRLSLLQPPASPSHPGPMCSQAAQGPSLGAFPAPCSQAAPTSHAHPVTQTYRTCL